MARRVEQTAVERRIVARVLREIGERDTSAAAFARETGMTDRSMWDMLESRRHILADDIPVLCRALHCDPNELFGVGKENGP